MAKPLKIEADTFIDVGFELLIDAVDKQEPADPKPLNSGLEQKHPDFEGLHSGERYLIFSANADSTHNEQSIVILACSGDDKNLQSLAQPNSSSLNGFLSSCRDDKSWFRWDQNHQLWSKLSEQSAANQQHFDTDFVELGQNIKHGELSYGILMTVRSNKISSERLTALKSTGLSMLSKISDHEKNDDKKTQTRSILTAGERRVMLWCGNGKTSFEISRILGLSEHTVNHYIASAVRKLDATNRTHAIAKALKMNIVDLSDIH